MLVWDYRMLVSKRLETMFCAGCCVSRRKDNLHVLVLSGSETRALLIARNSERNFPSVLFRLPIDEHIKTESLLLLSHITSHQDARPYTTNREIC
jgi:hypothetical protein